MLWIRKAVLFAAACLLVGSTTARPLAAQPVSYRFQAVGSGRWGASFFYGATVSFDVTSQVSAIESSPFLLCGVYDVWYPGIRATEGLVGTLNILGVGSAQIPNMYVWSIGYQQRVGLGTCSTADMLEGAHPTLLNYDLTTSTGILQLAPWTNVWFQNGNGLETSVGRLTFSQLESLTFEAVTTVPEPAGGSLISVGLVTLGIIARRRACAVARAVK